MTADPAVPRTPDISVPGDTPLTVINAFTVPPDSHQAFLEAWTRSAHEMADRPGFLDTTLHRSVEREPTFPFVNVAHWQSARALQSAAATQSFHELGLPIRATFSWYTVAFQLAATDRERR